MNHFLKTLIICSVLAGCDSSVKKTEDHSGMNMENMVHLNESQRERINLKIDTARIKSIYETTDFVGRATLNENSITTISSKVNGRIEKLMVRNPGEEIQVGQQLYSIYSEELLSFENEYLLAMKQQSEFPSEISKSLIESSYKSLLQWGLSENQIEELRTLKKASPYVTFSSNTSGFISELSVSEGQYISIGTPVYKVSSLESIWVSAEIYQSEISVLTDKSEVLIQFIGLAQVSGKIILNPAIMNPDKSVSPLLIEVQNTNGRIKPGMMATVTIRTAGKSGLVIPKSSLVLGKMTSVWIETKPGMYENRMIETGIENKTEVEIKSGLKAGDRVVSSGSYLLNSQYILQNGANSMPGMDM